MINNFDFTILSETWKKSIVQIEGFKIVVTNTLKTGKPCRNSGGLALNYKSKFDDWVSIQKSSPNFLWFTITNQCSKTEKDLYVCGTYIPPQNSCYFLTDLFGELENDVERFSCLRSILIIGDFNCRAGKYSDSVCQEGNTVITNDESEFSLYGTQRNGIDNELNNHGKRLLEICRNTDLGILNGRLFRIQSRQLSMIHCYILQNNLFGKMNLQNESPKFRATLQTEGYHSRRPLNLLEEFVQACHSLVHSCAVFLYL